jgi:large subunit ribosomal protein L4
VLRAAVGATGARLNRPVLVVVNADDTITQKSLRNIPRVKVLVSGQLNTYDVLACDHVVFTQAALAEFVARTGGGELVTVDKPARAARPTAGGQDGDEAGAKPARAAKATAAAEDGEESGAKAAKATASRARKPAAAATEPAGDADSDEERPAVKQRTSGTSRKGASSGSGATQKEDDDE